MAVKYQHFTAILLLASLFVGCGGGSSRRVERPPDPSILAQKAAAEAKAKGLPPPTAAAPPAKAPAAAAKEAEPGKKAPAVATAPTAPAAGTTPPAAGTSAVASPAPSKPATAPAAEAAPVVAEAKIPEVPSPNAVSIEPVPIDTQWPPEKKLEQTVLRMQKIVYAMHEYMKKENKLMPDAIYNKSGELPLLSWRVALLPYLGEEELFSKFNTKLAWNSQNGNSKLLTQIPSVYQSPWGTSADCTLFVVPRSPRGLFPGVEGRDPKLVTDDWSRTVALLMLEDSRAVQWTKPEDFRLKAGGSPGMLGKQTGGFLAAFADGEVSWLTHAAGREKLPALFTINGGEKISSAAVLAPEKAIEPLEKLARMGLEDVPELKPETQFPEFKSLVKSSADFSRPSSEGSGSDPKEDNRAAVPSAEALEIAKKQLKLVFKEQIEKLSKQYPEANMKSAATANLLLENLESVQSEPTQAYALLSVARDQAIVPGHYGLAVKATKVLAERYQVDSFQLQAETLLNSYSKCIANYPAQSKELKTDALWFVYKSLQLDDFRTASEMYKVIKRVTETETGGAGPPRMIQQGRVKQADIIGRGPRPGGGGANGGGRDQTEVVMQQMQSIEKEIEGRRKAFEKVPEAVTTLKQTPDDPNANLVLGRYKALIKLEWKEGGKYLAKGSNTRFKVLAALDAGPPADGKAMAELAGEYMALADQETGLYKRGLEMRALYWYQKAEPTVPGGFLKVQTEKYIKDITEKYSTEIVNEVMKIMTEKNE